MEWAYYNEIDSVAAAWLRELMADGLIMVGDVDERSICDVEPGDLRGYGRCHFFAGIGGWELALQWAGWPRERPVWTGSCPCQPFSSAGKGRGADDARHLWPEFFRLIRECRPDVVFGEQVAHAIGHGWLCGVQGDLEGEDYAVGAVVLGAHSVAAPHIRQRLWWVADADGSRERHNSSVDENPGWSATGGAESGRGAGVCRLADAADSGAGRASETESSGDGSDNGVSGQDCGVGGLDHDTGPRHDGTEQESEGDTRDQARLRVSGAGCAACGLADTELRRPEQRDADEWSVQQPDQDGSVDWTRAVWWPCRDGKWRRVPAGHDGVGAEPGVQCVADGVPGVLGELWAACDQERFPLAPKAEGRPGLLRGFGNAIVPQVAAAFARAYMEEGQSDG